MTIAFPRFPRLICEGILMLMDPPEMLAMGLTSKKVQPSVAVHSKKCQLNLVFYDDDEPCVAIIPFVPISTDSRAVDFNVPPIAGEPSEKMVWSYNKKNIPARFYGPNEIRLYSGSDYNRWELANLVNQTLVPKSMTFGFFALNGMTRISEAMIPRLNVTRVTLWGNFETEHNPYLDFIDYFAGKVRELDVRAWAPYVLHKMMDHWHYDWLNIEHCRWMVTDRIATVTNCKWVRFNRCRNFDEDMKVVLNKWVSEDCPMTHFEMILDHVCPPFSLEVILQNIRHVMIEEVTMSNGEVRRFEPNHGARIFRFDGVTAIVSCIGQAFQLDRE